MILVDSVGITINKIFQCQNQFYFYTSIAKGTDLVISYSYVQLIKSHFDIIVSLELFLFTYFQNILYCIIQKELKKIDIISEIKMALAVLMQ